MISISSNQEVIANYIWQKTKKITDENIDGLFRKYLPEPFSRRHSAT